MTGKAGENSDLQGPQDPRNDMMLSFLGFLFALNIPGLKLKKLAILDLPVGTDTHTDTDTHTYTSKALSSQRMRERAAY